MEGQRILGIVPARAGSKRIPGKNKRDFAGKPLFLWALEAALESSLIDKLVVSSDDAEILEAAARIDPLLSLERPAEISTDQSAAIEYVRHALDTLESGETRFDIVVIVQPTSPLVLVADIDQTIELLIQSGADTAVTVQRVDQLIHPFKLKQMQGDRLVPFLVEEKGRMAAHEIPDIFVRNGAVYASRRPVIDSGAVIGSDCRGLEMPRKRSVDINDEVDFHFAEFLLERLAKPQT